MGRQREKLNAGDVVNNFEILEELQPMQQNGYTFHEYKGKCLRCGTISIKTRYHFSKAGCRHCFNKSDEDIGKVGQQDKSMTREQIERLNRAPYIMEGLLTLRNEIIMQAATDPRAAELLLEVEKFNRNIWECACGEGHLSKVFKKAGYEVRSSDIIDRGYGDVLDFMQVNEQWQGDIITNPPYTAALEFAEKALEVVQDGAKVALFLKVLFLEGKRRKEFFQRHPPRTVYISSSRLKCAKNGDFTQVQSSAVAYAWFVWEKGYQGDTVIKWIN